MTMGLIAGAVALLLVLIVGVLVDRRRKPTPGKAAPAASPAITEEPQRRRTLGPGLPPSEPEAPLAEDAGA